MGHAAADDIVSNETAAPVVGGSAAPTGQHGMASADDIDTNVTRAAATQAQPPPDYLTKTEDFIQNATQGVGEAAGDVWGATKGIVKGAVKNAVLGPAVTAGLDITDAVKQTLPIINAYENARSSGASITDALKASDVAARQHIKNIAPIDKIVAAFKANPTQETARALTDASALAASSLVGGAEATPEEVAEATAIEKAAAPVSKLRVNPFSKIEPAVAAQTAKAGLPAGDAGLSAAEATQKTAQAALDAKAATQANVDQTLQNIATRHADANGLPVPKAGTAARDVLTNNGNALVDAGKADYKILDKYTDGKFTNAQNELKNAQLEMQQKAGTTSADSGDLEANVARAQWNVENLFDKAIENGMPKDVAETARTKFKTGQATLDIGNDVRMSNRITGPAGERVTNLNTLENRLQARYDSGRLQQALGGEQPAKDALTEVHAAREAAETYKSMPPTESKALEDLVRKNTTTGKFGTRTDWKGVRKDFSALPDRGARFSDVPKIEKFINDQAFYQNLRFAGKAAAAAAATGTAGAIGVGAYEAATK